MLKRILSVFLALMVLIFCLAGLLVGILWYRPDWLINKSTLQWAQERFLPGYSLPWDRLEFSLKRVASGRYSVFLSGQTFCQDLEVYGKACLDELIVDLEITTNFRDLQQLHIKNFTVKDQVIAILIPPSQEPQEPRPPQERDLDLQGWMDTARTYLERIQMDHHEIALDNTSLQLQGETPSLFHIRLTSHEALSFQVTQEDPSGLKLSGDLKKDDRALRLNSLVLIPLAELQLNAAFPLETDTPSLTGDFLFVPRTDQLKSLLRDVKSGFSLTLSKEDVSFALRSLEVALSMEPMESVKTDLCQTSLSLSMTKDIHLVCEAIDFNFDLARMDFKGIQPDLKDFPKQLTFKLESTLPASWVNDSPQASKEALFVSLNMTPIQHFLFQMDFAAQTGVHLNEETWALSNPSLNLSLDVPKFQNLVSRLQGSRFAVPAPFNILKGNLKAEVKEIPQASSDVFKVPFLVSTNLTGERNAVVGNAKGEFTYYFLKPPRRPELNLNVEVDQFHIQLPPFDPIRGIPSLTQDSRITKTLEPKTDTEAALDMSIQVRTTSNDSIRVYHPFLEPYASFGFRADVEKNTGFNVSKASSDFDINYLKRTVTVQNLNLTKPADKEEIEVSGQLMYQAAGYDVFIRFSGPMEKPEVVLTSEPPLERRDIISVLLYNRVDDNIAAFEQESVGGTEAALADRAIGLFGIWAFASTPIEAVSYNSVTGTYSAQIKLPEGFRFSIGTDWETVQNLELRRRVSGNWIVSTIYHPETDQGRSSSEIMLQRKVAY